ncbi:hypothetical protein ACMHYQ_11645 [Ectopseudomonas guguanensis]|uniref:hypothetical protein n=1 Tax=Ectopseudomonas guguanensis TaxID=1198456 RepID=UPI0039C0E0E7
MTIPARKDISEIEDKERRFHVLAPASVVVALQVEAGKRCTDAWRLGGAVIQSWLEAGCPDHIERRHEVGQ